jgi:hypothetical protein
MVLEHNANALLQGGGPPSSHMGHLPSPIMGGGGGYL